MSSKKKTQKSKFASSTKPILKVLWKDHFSTSNKGWSDLDAADHSPLICVSAGILVHEDKEVVTLTHAMSSSTRTADTITILKDCIVKREKLGEVVFG